MIKKVGSRVKAVWEKHYRLIIGIILALGLAIAIRLSVWAIQVPSWPQWSGVNGKTVWDLASLLIIPAALALAAFYLNRAQRASEQKIADERAKEMALQTYLDRMTDLLLRENLRTFKKEDDVRVVAQARMLRTLRDLDPERKGTLVKFLHEARLIRVDEWVIDLRGVNLREADLSEADLTSANLRGAILRGANLCEAILRMTDLSSAYLREANLSGADLSGANLLNKADLSKADLSRAKLRGVKIDSSTQIDDRWRLVWEIVNEFKEGRNLHKANLSGAYLSGADLSEANLSEANLRGADLRGANLSNADLSGTNLSKAKLNGTNLIDADLSGANLSGAILTRAKSNKSTTWPECFEPIEAGVIIIEAEAL